MTSVKAWQVWVRIARTWSLLESREAKEGVENDVLSLASANAEKVSLPERENT